MFPRAPAKSCSRTTHTERVWNYAGQRSALDLSDGPAQARGGMGQYRMDAVADGIDRRHHRHRAGHRSIADFGRRVASPFRGWHAWHHILGLFTATFVLTWIFSGWLSMDHGLLFSRGRLSAAEAARIAAAPDWAWLAAISVRSRRPSRKWNGLRSATAFIGANNRASTLNPCSRSAPRRKIRNRS